MDAIVLLMREVMIPITAALLRSFPLAPPVGPLRHWPRPAWPVPVSVAFAPGVILALGELIGAPVASLATALPRSRSAPLCSPVTSRGSAS